MASVLLFQRRKIKLVCHDTIYDVWLICYKGKTYGVGLSDKKAGSIIRVLPVPVSRGKNLYVGNSTCIQQAKISDMIYNVVTTIRQQWPERGGRVNA